VLELGLMTNADWTQLDRVQTSTSAAATDSRMCARIRPNRMKVSTSLPMEEELATIKRKKKVIAGPPVCLSCQLFCVGRRTSFCFRYYKTECFMSGGHQFDPGHSTAMQ